MLPQARTWTANEGLPSAAVGFDRKQTILCRCHQRIGNGEVWEGKWGRACVEPARCGWERRMLCSPRLPGEQHCSLILF